MPGEGKRPTQRYLDFDLEIGPRQEGLQYPVAVLYSPGGEARQTMTFPFDELALERHLDKIQIALLKSGRRRREIPTPEEQKVRDFGCQLFDALMAGEVRSRYDVSQASAATREMGLRLKLRINSPELATLPWEFLYDNRQGEYLCLSLNTPVVRYIELPDPPRSLAVKPPLRILGMISSPADLEPLETEKEKNRLERALRGLQKQGMVELVWLESGKWRDLQRILRTGTWHIFHFVGHGGYDERGEQGQLAFVGEDGRTELLGAIQLARLLANHRNLRLAILNACESAQAGASDLFSSTASLLVRRGLPAVFAMQYAITDRAATEFAQAFYEALADGFPVDAALAEARVAISLALSNSLEWGVPVLYMRSPDGLLFEMVDVEKPPQQEAMVGRQPAETITEQRRPVGTPTVERSEQDKASAEVHVISERRGRNANRLILTLAKGINMELMRIPAGEFLMGTSDLYKSASQNEKPQHRVYLNEFFIGRYPVTNMQYQAFRKAVNSKSPLYWKGDTIPSGKKQHPVVGVTWEDAVAFCNWVSVMTGRDVFLPTEAQWEKAARGIDGRHYPWGKEWDAQRLNNLDSGRRDTTPVGMFSPAGDSPYGCSDMAGNVWEWCADWYDGTAYLDREIDLVRNPAGPARGKYRVVRGGSTSSSRKLTRCAFRLKYDPADFNNYLGFRIVVFPR